MDLPTVISWGWTLTAAVVVYIIGFTRGGCYERKTAKSLATSAAASSRSLGPDLRSPEDLAADLMDGAARLRISAALIEVGAGIVAGKRRPEDGTPS